MRLELREVARVSGYRYRAREETNGKTRRGGRETGAKMGLAEPQFYRNKSKLKGTTIPSVTFWQDR